MGVAAVGDGCPAAMNCPICSRAPAQHGVLCEDCRDELIGPVAITAQQIAAVGPASSRAALVDVWGALHRLANDTVLGRTTDPPAISIVEPSISRRHARLWVTDGSWQVHDLGSANRTYVDGRTADRPIPIHDGQQLRIGYVAFYFLADADGLAAPAPITLSGQTAKASGTSLRREAKTRAIEIPPLPDQPPPSSELPVVALELHQPTGGGAGVVELEGKRVQLTLPQYELIARLVERMGAHAREAAEVRGFVSPGELAGLLSLDTSDPGDDNIRQLVRRVRRACERAGMRDLIESRYGLGYRLSVTPRLR